MNNQETDTLQVMILCLVPEAEPVFRTETPWLKENLVARIKASVTREYSNYSPSPAPKRPMSFYLGNCALGKETFK